jgi:hypothetical protein
LEGHCLSLWFWSQSPVFVEMLVSTCIQVKEDNFQLVCTCSASSNCLTMPLHTRGWPWNVIKRRSQNETTCKKFYHHQPIHLTLLTWKIIIFL